MVTSDAMTDCYGDSEYEIKIANDDLDANDIECGDCEEVEDDE